MNSGSLVVDASVAVKWYLPPGSEPNQPEAVGILKEFSEGRIALHVPDLVYLEVANVLGRRAPHPERHFDEFLALPLIRHAADDALMRRALGLQMSRRLIFFDAIYLALAESLRIPLVTADRDLVRGARGAAIILGGRKKPA